MNANDFNSRWDAVVSQARAKADAAGVPEIADYLKLVGAAPSILDAPSFPPDAAQFLVASGLPRSCAPFLSFAAVIDGGKRAAGWNSG